MITIFGVPVDAAYHLVFALTTWFTPVLGGLAAVTGIVLLTLVVRLLMLPLSFRALRGQAVAAKLAPRLQALRLRRYYDYYDGPAVTFGVGPGWHDDWHGHYWHR